jgi:leucyl aminopeptidase (aminopeptidase T)
MTMTCVQQEQIRQGVKSMLETNLAIQPGETVLVITDPPTLEQWVTREPEELEEALERCILARMVADLTAELVPGAEIAFLAYPAVEQHGGELDAATEKKMAASDVVIAITNRSMTHTMAAEAACKAGSRIASMPGFLASMFEGPMTADHQEIARHSRALAELLTNAHGALVTTPDGTALALDLSGRVADVDVGLITAPGRLDNLPAGEAFIAPVETKAQGKVVVTPRGRAGLQAPMTIYFEKGEVCCLEGGGSMGEELVRTLELPTPGLQSARRNLAELGIGTNPKAHSVESLLEAEKIKGTVHIAIGDNAHIGGVVQADLHMDFVLWDPDLTLDGKTIIRRGKWMFEPAMAE